MNRPVSIVVIALLCSLSACLGTPPPDGEVDAAATDVGATDVGGDADGGPAVDDVGEHKREDQGDDDEKGDAALPGVEPALPADYVRSSRFERLNLVIHRAKEITPRRAAADHVAAELGAALDKPGGVIVESSIEFESEGSDHVWTLEELKSLASERFGRGYTEDAIEIGILYLDGSYEDDGGTTQVLGVAWGNRYIAMFADSIDDACAGAGIDELCEVAEASVLLHEVGHVIGLVDNGAPMQNDHSDPEHGKHDVNDDCVMYWAYTNSNIIETLLARIATGEATNAALTFDEACLADLAALQ